MKDQHVFKGIVAYFKQGLSFVPIVIAASWLFADLFHSKQFAFNLLWDWKANFKQ